VSLSLTSPTTVTEDGSQNLFYTFTRTGSTTNTLTVNYTIGGTATNGNDYSNVGTSVTFAAGSSTATVTVDPTADTTVESDETVFLTLASGTGYTIGTPAQTEQYASTVISFSSQWSVGSWGAVQILGEPNTLSYGDLPTSWSPKPANADGYLQADEFITVGFTTPVYASGIEVRETYGNGFVRSIDLLSNQGTYYSVWSGIDTSKPGAPVDFKINFDQTSYLVVGARINVDIDHTSSWEEIDSVKLIGTTSAVTGTITNDDPFTGTPNADTLIGTTGADTLIGLAGNDTYTVNHVGDIVTEALNAGTDLVNASISYTLPNNVENLTLTGSSNINGTGNNLNNTLTGNSGNNTLNGGLGNDTLTGGVGSDIFVFQFGQSLLSGADRITDFAIGSDKIDLLTSSGGAMNAPTAFTRAANSTATTLANMVNSVFIDANGALTGNQALGVNSAALVSATTSGIAGTYLVINDGVAGFQSSNDLLVNITGYTGTLPALGTIAVSSFFI
jgi:Ca2+-binding RTX toxin-like protein